LNDPPTSRPRLRFDDVFDIVAIDDSFVDLRVLESLVLRAFRPRARMRAFLDLASARPSLAALPPHLVIIDDQMGTLRAEDTLAELRGSGYLGPVAVISGGGLPGRGAELLQKGVLAYLAKDDLNITSVITLIDQAMKHLSLWSANRDDR